MSRRDLVRNVPLRALLVAEVVSTTGTQITWLALPWFVLVTTGSPARMTVVMIAGLVGGGVAAIPAGSLLQRLGARRTMLTCDALRAPLMLVLPVLHWSGRLSFGVLVLAALALGLCSAPFFSAQKMIVPELLGEDERVVTQANALFQGAIRTTMLLGPPLAGVLIGVMGAASVLLVDAATYAVSFLLVASFVPARARDLFPLPHRPLRRAVRRRRLGPVPGPRRSGSCRSMWARPSSSRRSARAGSRTACATRPSIRSGRSAYRRRSAPRR